MMYGDNLVWKKVMGRMQPFFIDGSDADGNPKMMEFTVDDDDLDGFNSSQKYVETEDTYRNWYFVSDEDRVNILHPTEGSGLMTYDEFSQSHETDISGYSYEQKQRDDWRRVLDIMGKEKQVAGTAQDTWTTTDKGLRRVMNAQKTWTAQDKYTPSKFAGQYLSELTPGVDDDEYAEYMRENEALGWLSLIHI